MSHNGASCDKCLYSERRTEVDMLISHPEFKLECRRHAPTLLLGSGTGWSSQLFPFVNPDNWCGEFHLIQVNI